MSFPYDALMKKLSHFLLLLGCALVAFSLPIAAQDPPAAPATLFIVRHAEKSAPNGDLPLSAEGRSRAALLASMVRDAGISRIYTTEMVRTRETAEPLERQLRLFHGEYVFVLEDGTRLASGRRYTARLKSYFDLPAVK